MIFPCRSPCKEHSGRSLVADMWAFAHPKKQRGQCGHRQHHAQNRQKMQRAGGVCHAQGDGQDGGDHDAHQGERLPPANDAGALGVIGGKLGAPGLPGQGDQAPGQGDRGIGTGKPQRPRAGRRVEQGRPTDQPHRDAEQNGRAPAADAGAGAVGQSADQRVDRHIAQPHQRQHQPDETQAQPHRPRPKNRQMHSQWQAQQSQRQGRGRVGEKFPPGDAGGGESVCLLGTQAVRASRIWPTSVQPALNPVSQ